MGPKSSGHFWNTEKYLAAADNRTPDLVVRKIVAIPTVTAHL
jgi:hypothetical protein